MNNINWLGVATSALGLMFLFATVKWYLAKSLLKEVSEALVTLSAALDDNKITPEEFENCRQEFSDVLWAATKLLAK